MSSLKADADAFIPNAYHSQPFVVSCKSDEPIFFQTESNKPKVDMDFKTFTRKYFVVAESDIGTSYLLNPIFNKAIFKFNNVQILVGQNKFSEFWVRLLFDTISGRHFGSKEFIDLFFDKKPVFLETEYHFKNFIEEIKVNVDGNELFVDMAKTRVTNYSKTIDHLYRLIA